MNTRAQQDFRLTVWDYYRAYGRHNLPWRTDVSPYAIFVSEIMLQQTQVERVVHKFNAFLAQLPDWQALDRASTKTVLRLWQGLGYTRRALWLKTASQRVVGEFSGNVPDTPEVLQTFTGIGPNTAGSIAAFAFNKPVVFIETNIRRAYIHHFFPHQALVSDRDILTLIATSLDTNNSREWYWALMDYGSHLAKTTQNPNHQSKHYTKQSKFSGSVRQVRGAVLRELLLGPQTTPQLQAKIPDSRLNSVLDALTKESFIEQRGQKLTVRDAKR